MLEWNYGLSANFSSMSSFNRSIFFSNQYKCTGYGFI